MCSGRRAHALGHLRGGKTKRVQLVSPSSALLRPNNSKNKRPRFLQLTFSHGGRFVAGFFAAASMKVTCLTPPAKASATSEETAQNSSWALVDSKERKRRKKNNGILFTALALSGELMWDYTEMISSTLS